MISYHQEYFGACSSGNHEMVKYLYPKLNNIEHRLIGFKKACITDDIVIAQWIYDQKDVTISTINELKTEDMSPLILDWFNKLSN